MVLLDSDERMGRRVIRAIDHPFGTVIRHGCPNGKHGLKDVIFDANSLRL
jgi:hypothetical protein